MKKIYLILFLQFFAFMAFGQHKRAYKIYNAKGKKMTYGKMMKSLVEKDIILFGEQHNNPIAHWLQYEVTADLHEERELILGAEMIEADNQDVLNRYLQGEINYTELDSLARLWRNHKTDYAPLVDFAKEKGLIFVASNIPRRYANMVYKQGFEVLDALSTEEKTWMAPLPMPFDSELPTYKKILKMPGGHGTPELVKAQATKDATMAYFIAKNYKPTHLFLHFNGAGHSDEYEGILWYLKRELADLNYATITTVSQENIKTLANKNRNKADFIICVDSHMTRTY